MVGIFLGNVWCVDFCFEVYNIIVWKEVLIRFNCFDDIRKKVLYYCFLSSYFNEIIEFCVLNVVIDEGWIYLLVFRNFLIIDLKYVICVFSVFICVNINKCKCFIFIGYCLIYYYVGGVMVVIS